MQLCWNFCIFHKAAFFGKAFGNWWKEVKITQDFFLEAHSMEYKTLKVGFPVNYRPQQLVSWDGASPCSLQTALLASRGSEEGLSHRHAKTPSVMCPASSSSSSRLGRCIREGSCLKGERGGFLVRITFFTSVFFPNARGAAQDLLVLQILLRTLYMTPLCQFFLPKNSALSTVYIFFRTHWRWRQGSLTFDWTGGVKLLTPSHVWWVTVITVRQKKVFVT